MKTLNSLALRFEWKGDNGKLFALDQTLLPHEEKWHEANSIDRTIELIQALAIRGAPLIGVAAALSLAQYSLTEKNKEKLLVAAKKLREARPTAVNLMNCIDRMQKALHAGKDLVAEATAIFEEDVALCEGMAKLGCEFINDGDGVLTHCNTGGLATVGIGTALGVIHKAWTQGKKIHVYVDETRPLLQGARLTAWELEKLKIPYTLICDNMAGFLMSQGKIQKIFTGADRIAVNGDTANKIGTYSVAVLAHYHKIPFYIVAPDTTLDPDCATGAQIPIEERNPEEVKAGKSPRSALAWNPAFDVTPRSLIKKIILNDRVL